MKKIEAEIQEEAARRMNAGKKIDHRENFPQGEKGRTTDKLSAMAGISGKTYEKASHIIDNAPEPPTRC